MSHVDVDVYDNDLSLLQPSLIHINIVTHPRNCDIHTVRKTSQHLSYSIGKKRQILAQNIFSM